MDKQTAVSVGNAQRPCSLQVPRHSSYLSINTEERGWDTVSGDVVSNDVWTPPQDIPADTSFESKWTDPGFEQKKTPDLEQMDFEQYQVNNSTQVSLGVTIQECHEFPLTLPHIRPNSKSLPT